MKKITLSKIAVAFSLCYASAQFSYAEIKPADANTQVSAQKGVEIVNIATPSASGLSHNQYNKFNVNRAGAVLNNAQQAVNTQLAGNVAANPNLHQQAATVILNEVISRNPSKLAGKQEIAGQKADYVLANPNGISCEGCGFINTPRASLVVGKATVKQGDLTGFDVTGNRALTTKGKVSGVNDLDLIAPTVKISGSTEISGQVNIIAGHNRIDRDANGELSVTVQPYKGKALDGKIAGSIQAGRIRIHSSDDKSTLQITNAQLQAKEVAITAGNTKLSGEITQKNSSSSHKGKEARNVSVSSRQTSKQQQYHQTQIKADTLVIGTEHKLDITGADIQAKDVVIVGGDTHFGTQTTTNMTSSSSQRSKGAWYRNEDDASKVQTVHRTTIAADKIEVAATQGKLTGQGVKLDAKDVGLYGEKGIALSGAKETDHHQAMAYFQRESAKLKTGHSNQSATEQRYVASEINTKEHLVLGGKGDIALAGVKGEVDGNLAIQNTGKTQFLSETLTNTHSVDDKEKFWGGLAGSKTLTSSGNSVVQEGADITVKGKIAVSADKGVKLAGSRVISGEGSSVEAPKGNLVIDAVKEQTVYNEYNRQGTIFDITKARDSVYRKTTVSKGSTLESQSDLKLVSGKNVEIIGSTAQAGGLLDITALNKITIKGAENSVNEHKESAGFTLNGKVDKPQISLSKDSVIKASIDAVKSMIKGESNLPQAVKNVAETAKDNVKLDAGASVGLSIYKKQEDGSALTHSAASVSGGSTHLTSKQVLVAGSQVSATNGDLTINADKIRTQAQQDQFASHKKSTDAALKAEVKLTESAATLTLSATLDHLNESKQGSDAKVSQLSATNDIRLNAKQIHHVGTNVKAGNDLIENADQINHSAAYSQNHNHSKNLHLGATLTTSIDKSKAISGSLNLNAEGGRENVAESNAMTTILNAGNNIAIKGKRVNDHGSQYQAGNNVSVSAHRHNLVSAQNTNHKDSLSAGVSLGIEASSSDLNTVDASVNAGVKFQKDQSATSNAVKPTIQGANVHLNANQLHSQADISATDNVNINAQKVHFSQSNNHSSAQGGGFEVNVGVGALVIPSAGAAVPSVSVDVSANGKNNHSVEAVTNTIKGKNVAVNGKQGVHLQGSSLEASESASIAGKKVKIEAGHSKVDNVEAEVGVGVSVGAKLSDLGLNGKVKVGTEHSQTHPSVSVNAPNVSINADNGATLSGVTSNAENLSLNTGKGDLHLVALKNQVNKTDVDTNLSLSGDLAENKWTPASGSGALNVNVIRNQTHTTTELNATNANVNVGGNAQFNGGSVNAENASGLIQGNAHHQVVSDKINETSVNLSANGSGKFTPYPADKWQESAKKDWDNGTIAGVNADIKVEANALRKETNSKVGINAKQNKLTVKGKVTHGRVPATRHKAVRVNIHSHTHLKQAVQKFREAPFARRQPIISVRYY